MEILGYSLSCVRSVVGDQWESLGSATIFLATTLGTFQGYLYYQGDQVPTTFWNLIMLMTLEASFVAFKDARQLSALLGC